MRKSIAKIVEYLDFVPMTVFLLLFKMGIDWPEIFTSVGAISLFFMITHFAFLKRRFRKPLLLGVNLFFVGGLLMIVFNINWLIFVYQSLMQGAFFGAITFVAFASAIFEPRAFLENKTVEISLARKLALVMGGGCVVATIFAWYFKGDFFIQGSCPSLGYSSYKILFKLETCILWQGYCEHFWLTLCFYFFRLYLRELLVRMQFFQLWF